MSSRLLTCPPDFSCPPAHSLVVMIHATLPGDPLMDTYYGWIGAPVVARLQPVQPCCLRNCSMWGCVSAEGAECDSPSPRADAGGRGTEQVGTSTAAVHNLSRGIQTDQDETVCLG